MTQIGRYQLRGELAQGGMAVVYHAYDPFFERQVAIKVMAAHYLRDPRFRQRFKQEAQIIASLQHPAIVPVYDFGEHNGQPYFVMALIAGGSLTERLKEGPFSLNETVQFLQRIAPALDLAHQQGIVHRDLKPDNILFDKQENPYLADFGIAKLLAQTTRGLTSTGVVIGTPFYMSPEQIKSQADIDGRSDIYSLGVMLFEMLTGQLPFEAEMPGGFIYKHLYESPISICSLRPDLPANCDTFMAQAMAKERDGRYHTVGEMAATLKAIAEGRFVATTIGSSHYPKTPTAHVTWGAKPPAPVAPPLNRPWWQKGIALASAMMLLVVCTVLATLMAVEELNSSAAATLIASNQQPSNATFAPQAASPAPQTASPAPSPTPSSTPPQEQSIRPTLSLPTSTLIPSLTRVIEDTFDIPGSFTPIPTTPLPSATSTFSPIPPSPTLTVQPSVTFMSSPSTQTNLFAPDGMEFVFIPAGDFIMGTTPDDPKADPEEQPQHVVYLDAFWIDKTEVTNAMFAYFVNETDYQTDAEKGGGGEVSWHYTNGANWQHPQGPNSTINGRENHPVALVSWHDATAYCTWAGRRLPTEAEWEKAARGTDGRLHPWGNQATTGYLANFGDTNLNETWADHNINDGYGFTAPVGNYPAGASPYGALDMAGNLWEWVADWYDENYYATSPTYNPLGPLSGQKRVLKGGAWYNGIKYMRPVVRLSYAPEGRSNDFGFRCAMDDGG